MRNDELKDTLLDTLIRHRQMTRQEFIRLNPCRPASMLTAINALKHDGVIVEPERAGGKTGRKSPALSINPALGVFVGIELQVHRVLGVAVDGGEKMLARAEVAFPSGITAAAVPGKLRELLEILRRQLPPDAPPWRGVGFADPGLVDLARQQSLRAHNIAGWTRIPIAAWLRELSGVDDIFILPETMSRAYAEYAFHRPELPGSMFLLELDSGIGGSFLKRGMLFAGENSRGMEIGHLVVRPGGPLCKCGNQGCLEAIAGENGIRQRVAEMRAGNVRTELDATNFSLEHFVELVNHHDRAAELLAREVCDGIAPAVSIVVTLLNPALIVISGRLSGLGDLLIDAIDRTLKVNCFHGAIDKLKLEITRLDDYAAASGAALTARRKRLLPDKPLWW